MNDHHGVIKAAFDGNTLPTELPTRIGCVVGAAVAIYTTCVVGPHSYDATDGFYTALIGAFVLPVGWVLGGTIGETVIKPHPLVCLALLGAAVGASMSAYRAKKRPM